MTEVDEELPVGWTQTTLGEVAEVRLGRTPARKEERFWKDGRHPWVAIADLTNGKIRSTRELVSDSAWYEVLQGKVAPAGTLLLSFKLTIGKVGILEMPAAHNEAIAAVLPEETAADRDFLFFRLQSLDYNRYKDTYVKGATLSKEKLQALPLALPPVPEQRAIAHVLRVVQGAKEATEQVVTAAQELKKSLVREFFRGEWQERRIGEFCQTSTGGTPDRQRSDYFGGEISWVKSGEVADSVIRHTSETLTSAGLRSCNARLFPAGTLLMAMYGAGVTAARVGLLEITAATNQAVCAILPENGQADSRYLYQALIHLRQDVRNARHGSNQPNLSQRIIKGLSVPLPPLNEQHRIVEMAEVVDRKIIAEEARRDALSVRFDSLLHDLMTARLRVTDLKVPA